MTQSGEVVSHRAHNPGTGGANPSSATNYGSKYMYAITITTTPDNSESDFILYPDGYEHCCKHWDAVVNWLSECIDQNLILNLCTVSSGDEWPDITIYYSVNAESAQQFVDKWMDLDAEFSMQKFWKMLDLSQTSQIEIVDFEEVWSEPLVSEDKSVIWNVWEKPA